MPLPSLKDHETDWQDVRTRGVRDFSQEVAVASPTIALAVLIEMTSASP